MSRIHDALRRAEKERTSQEAKGGKEALGLTPDILVSSLDDERNFDLPALSSQPAEVQGFLKYETLANRCAHPHWRIDPQTSIFEESGKDSVGAEGFRTLRSRLCQIASTNQLRKVLITSSVPAEGKSLIATNLAQSFARHPDSRVLLIDADLRASRLHLALGAPKTPGLTNYLRGETDELSIIQIDPQKGFAFIPSGDEVADPSELILGDRMRKLLDVVTPVFDWVIVDSPPALPVHDANLLADLCDGVLFVVKAGETSYENAVKASSEFRQKSLLGVVLNQVEKADFHQRHYYASQYDSALK